MFGAETLDHVGIPIRDLDRAEKFYTETLGLGFLTRRKNADGSPRHTYVLAGENIIGLNLPGIQTSPSPSGAPRYAIAVEREERFAATVKKIMSSAASYGALQEHSSASPFLKSFCFDDPDNNHIELCLRHGGPGGIYPVPQKAPYVSAGMKVLNPKGHCPKATDVSPWYGVYLSHVVFETADLNRSAGFYTEALGLKPVPGERGETLFSFKNHQMLGLKGVAALSERTKKHGRAVHVAFNVSQEDYDRMVALVTEKGGRSLGDHRADDGLRPPGERSIYFFDPDTNYLQITAHGEENWDLLPDEEKWRRIVENRKQRGQGISSFDAGKRGKD